jgi:hypothetical protein
MVRRVLYAMMALAGSIAGCLPGDTRPVPCDVLVTASGPSTEPGARPAFTSDDGWSLEFSKVLASFGSVELGGRDCNKYPDSGYGRLLNLGLFGPQKIRELFVLGACDLSFGLSPPPHDVVSGAEVSAEDVTLMRGGSGQPSPDSGSGYGFYVAGTAVRGAVTKTFAWGFTVPSWYTQCLAPGSSDPSFQFFGDQSLSLDVPFDLRAIFRAAPGDDAAALFDAFADADTLHGDHDGQVTLGDLDSVSLQALSSSGVYDTKGLAYPVIKTLGDYVRYVACPRVARHIAGRTCANPAGIVGE